MTLKFKPEKLVHSLVFFSNAGVSDLTKLKAAKLFYFADKEHLLRFGRPILGDVYYCLPYGPVPSVALNEMSDASEKPEVDDSDRNLFCQYLEVKKGFFNRHPVFKAKREHDPDVFSESELEVLGNVVRQYGRYSAGTLVGLTHAEQTWKIPNEERSPDGRARIPYELFFVGADENARTMLELFRSEHEEARELDAILNPRNRQLYVNV
jgi:uncharacterized phage-associated protein